LIFKGELSRFHPADILIFLSHLESNGVLSVRYNGETLTIALKDGRLVDTHSRQGDDKLLRILFFNKMIDNNQLKHFSQVKQETGMPLGQILEELKIDITPAMRDVFADGIQEVLLEFFLLESGEFHFTDVMVDMGLAAKAFDCRFISLEMARQTDEWRDFDKNLCSLESRIKPTAAVTKAHDLSDLEKAVIGLASKNLTLRRVIQLIPYPSFQSLKTVENLFSRKLLDLQPLAGSQPEVLKSPVYDALFFEFKRAFKKIVAADDIRKKLSAVVSFCKNYFERILVLTARDLQILQGTLIRVEKNGSIQQKKIEQPMGRLDEDPGFYAVYRSGVGFLGKAYPSSLLGNLIDLPSSGECAIIPVGKRNDISLMLYVVTADEQHGLNAFHYLELLAWLIGPPAEHPPLPDQPIISTEAAGSPKIAAVKSPSASPSSDRIQAMIDKVEDLPPLPSVVFQILELLADPDFAMDKLEKLVRQDQSLVAKLIKVSNSVLYGGIGDVGSLREALARLGARTVKSLVLTTSTHTFFPKTQSGIGIWSQLLWQHSVECGLAARCVARKTGRSDADEAFVGGVLHDIGKLVILLKFPDEYRRIQKMSKSEGVYELAVESELLGCDHTMIGEKLMKKWKMPAGLKDCVQLHHRFREADEGDQLIPIVAYGNYLSHTYSFHSEISQMEKPTDIDYLVKRLRLTEAQNEALQKEITENFQNDNLFD